MYTLAVRYVGEGAWRTGYLPRTLQSAYGDARVMSGQKRFADEVRVVASTPARLIDIRV